MGPLANLLATQQDVLLQRWSRACAALPASSQPPPDVLAAHLPVLLGGLVAALRRFPVGSWEGPVARQELDPSLGLDPLSLVRVYGRLGTALFDLALQPGANATPAELRCLADFMTEVVARGIEACAPRATATGAASEAGREEPGLPPIEKTLREQNRTLQAALTALTLRAQRTHDLLEAAGVGTWELDLAAQTIDADVRASALHGCLVQGPCSLERWLQAVHPEDQPRVRGALEAARVPGAPPLLAAYRVTDDQGVERWVEARGSAGASAAGAARHLRATLQDITARATDLPAPDAVLDALAAHPFLQVSLLEGPQHIFRMANQPYLREVGRGRALLGRPAFEALPEFAGQGFEALLEKALQTGQPSIGVEQRALLDRGDGTREERFYTFVYQPLRAAGERPASILSISADVTEVVQVRQRLARQATELQARAAFERQLIGIVSHDLKNPLSSLLLRAEFLAEAAELSPQSRDAIRKMKATILRTVRLVSDLLDFTTARLSGALPLSPAPTNLQTVVAQVLEEVELSFTEVRFAFSAHGDTSGLWDAARLGQVALNLLANAAKFSPPGGTVRVTMEGEEDAVRLAVTNAGHPIPAEVRAHLFEPLQGGAGVDPTGRSLGLGLFIVKHLVDAHRGTLDVHSDETATTFTVVLPRRALSAR